MTESNNSDTVINSSINVKEKKTKDYVLRAIYKYRKIKYAEDEEFREQELARSREYYQKNKEKHSLYMKEYYARKKREKEQAKQDQSSETNKPDINTNLDAIADSLDNLTLQSAVKAT